MQVLPARFRGIPLILLSSVFFGAMAVFARTLSGRMPTGELVAFRFVLGLLGIVPSYVVQRRLPKIPRPGMWALRGLFGGASVYLYFMAIERLESGPATLLNCTAPCWTALFAWMFLRERMGRQAVVGLLVATFGAGLVIWSMRTPSHPLELGLGVWAGVASAVFSGAAQAVIKSLRRDTDSVTVFLSFSIMGLLIAIPFAIRDWQPISTDLWMPALAVGLTSFAGQMLFTYAFKYVSATAGSAGNQLTPAVSWALGVSFLGESLTPLALIGAVVCAAGVLWGAGIAMRHEPPPPAPGEQIEPAA